MSIDLAVQIAIRKRLMATAAVTDRVPAGAILDRLSVPAPTPSIIIGEAQVTDPGTSLSRTRHRVFHTLHVWKRDVSREDTKRTIAAIRDALLSGRLDLGTGLHCIDLVISGQRVLADPDGETAHGVLAVDALVEEVAP